MDRLFLWIAQGGGLGRVPKIPGTVGTLGGFPLTALLLLPGNFWAYLAGCVLCIPISAWICEESTSWTPARWTCPSGKTPTSPPSDGRDAGVHEANFS